MTIEKSVYNFKDDGTLITMPENILIPNVKPRTGLHVKYLTPLMHYQMLSKQKPNVLILGNLKDADAYSKLAQAHEYASNIPTLDGIVQFGQLNNVDLNLYTGNKPHMYFYAVPSSSDPSNVSMRVLARTLLGIMDYYIELHIKTKRPFKVYIDNSVFNVLDGLGNNVLNYINSYLAISLGQDVQFIIASKSDPRTMSGVLATNSTTINLDNYSIDLDRYNESLGRNVNPNYYYTRSQAVNYMQISEASFSKYFLMQIPEHAYGKRVKYLGKDLNSLISQLTNATVPNTKEHNTFHI